ICDFCPWTSFCCTPPLMACLHGTPPPRYSYHYIYLTWHLQMDPVQKAVINHTFGVPVASRKKMLISCNICQLRFNSQNQADSHYKGHKHVKKLKSKEDPPKQSSVLSTSPSTNTTHTGAGDDWTVKAEVVEENVGETEEQKMKRLLYCSLCKVAVNSLSQLQGHNKGKHKAMLEGKDPPFMRRPSRHKSTAGAAKASSAARVKDFHCELCQLKVNSDTQLQQHLASRRHKDKLAGKPPKPKFSPYSKLQRKSSSLFAKLALHKGLGKSLTTTSFLPTPLAVAAATAVSMGTPFALRTLPGASAIFPRPILAQTLLRPAPGPMRSTPHGAILFAPY
uniref:C2H2-type domain-containing protein n=1 Tax=Eptatretus burgeri TaxID=7764 RepID=A0A8C4R335_EPTBU